MPADDAPITQGHALVERIATLLDEVHALRLQLERAPQPNESASAEAERLLYFALAGALEAGLIRTMEDVLTVLRQASQPLGPMGAEWLARQARALEDGRE